jgi:hypothetical protein
MGGPYISRNYGAKKSYFPVASKKVMFTTPKRLRLRNFIIRGKVDCSEVR